MEFARQQLRLGRPLDLAIIGGKQNLLTDTALEFRLKHTGLWSNMTSEMQKLNVSSDVKILDYIRAKVSDGNMIVGVRQNIFAAYIHTYTNEDEIKMLDALVYKYLLASHTRSHLYTSNFIHPIWV